MQKLYLTLVLIIWISSLIFPTQLVIFLALLIFVLLDAEESNI